MHRNVIVFRSIVAFMEDKLKRYWQKIPPLYYVAVVLDPRVKLQGVDFLMQGIAKKLQVASNIITNNDVKTRMIAMFDCYNRNYRGSSGTSSRPATFNIIPPSGSSWQEIMKNPCFSLLSSLSSTHCELENYYDTNFSAHFCW